MFNLTLKWILIPKSFVNMGQEHGARTWGQNHTMYLGIYPVAYSPWYKQYNGMKRVYNLELWKCDMFEYSKWEIM